VTVITESYRRLGPTANKLPEPGRLWVEMVDLLHLLAGNINPSPNPSQLGTVVPKLLVITVIRAFGNYHHRWSTSFSIQNLEHKFEYKVS